MQIESVGQWKLSSLVDVFSPLVEEQYLQNHLNKYVLSTQQRSLSS